MALQTIVESKIPALYKRTALNQMMFAFILGVKATLHTVTTQQAILMFMESFELTHEEFNLDSALVIYNRMQKEFINLN